MGVSELQKILIVNLPHWERRIIKDLLTDPGRDLLAVENDEAAKKIMAYEPHLIIADPAGGSLDEMIEARDTLEGRPSILIISLDRDFIKKALLKGCEDYIVRPFEHFEITHRLDKMLPRTRDEKENISLGPSPDEALEPKQRESGSEKSIPSGSIHLISEPKPKRGHKILKDFIERGTGVLALTRNNPKNLRLKLGEGDYKLVWLTANMMKGENCLDPKELNKITREIESFLEEKDRGLLFLDGLEYVVSQVDFPSVLRMVQYLNDKIMISDDRMLISLDPRAFSSQELSLIERECVVWD